MQNTEMIPRTQRDWHNIRRFVDHESQADFGELIRQYMPMVYSVCLRELGNAGLAEDAAQAVFLVLARKARTFRSGIVVSTWLFEVSRLICRNARRNEYRRNVAEQEAAQLAAASTNNEPSWGEIEPHLHDAVAKLKRSEQELILLRFFEQHSLREIGSELQLSEDAARMRLNRALEKLRRMLAKAGIAVGAVALGTLLLDRSGPAITGPTAERLANHTHMLISAGAVGGSVHVMEQGAIHTMKLIKMKAITIVAASSAFGVVAAGSVAFGLYQHHKFQTIVGIPPAKTDPHAVALLKQCYQTYASLRTYADVETCVGGQIFSIPPTLKITFQRPSVFALAVTPEHGDPYRVVGDTQYAYVIPDANPTKIQRRELPKTGPRYWGLIEDAGLQSPQIPAMLANPHLGERISKPDSKAIIYVARSEEVDGVMCDDVAEVSRSRSGFAFSVFEIGRDDHLVRRMIEHTPQQGQTGSIDILTDITDIKTNAQIPASTFAYIPGPADQIEDTNTQTDKAAQDVIQKMENAYLALTSFTCTEDVEPSGDSILGNAPKGPWQTIEYAVQGKKNAAFHLRDTDNRNTLDIVSDGHFAYAAGTGRYYNVSKYMKFDLTTDPNNLANNTTNFVRDAYGFVVAEWVPELLMGWVAMPADGGYGFEMRPSTKVNGEPVDCVLMPLRVTNKANTVADEGELLYVSQRDHLIREIDNIRSNNGKRNVWKHVYKNIQVNQPIPASAFHFTPPSGATPTALYRNIQNLR